VGLRWTHFEVNGVAASWLGTRFSFVIDGMDGYRIEGVILASDGYGWRM
jgi:hypothetical protein